MDRQDDRSIGQGAFALPSRVSRVIKILARARCAAQNTALSYGLSLQRFFVIQAGLFKVEKPLLKRRTICPTESCLKNVLRDKHLMSSLIVTATIPMNKRVSPVLMIQTIRKYVFALQHVAFARMQKKPLSTKNKQTVVGAFLTNRVRDFAISFSKTPRR